MMSPENLLVIAAGIFLLTGMLLGVWKYAQMSRPPHKSHPYVDTAHRAGLMYAFACVVLAELARLSQLDTDVELAAAIVSIVFFAMAVGAYIFHGWQRRGSHQYTDAPAIVHLGTYALIVGEIGAAGILVYGAILAA